MVLTHYVPPTAITVIEAWGDIIGLGLNWLSWADSVGLLIRVLVLGI